MSTLKDVVEFYRTVWVVCDLFGFSDGFKEEFGRRFQMVGNIIRFEGGHNVEEAMVLPVETELGSKAEAEFQILKNWFYGLPTFARATTDETGDDSSCGGG